MKFSCTLLSFLVVATSTIFPATASDTQVDTVVIGSPTIHQCSGFVKDFAGETIQLRGVALQIQGLLEGRTDNPHIAATFRQQTTANSLWRVTTTGNCKLIFRSPDKNRVLCVDKKSGRPLRMEGLSSNGSSRCHFRVENGRGTRRLLKSVYNGKYVTGGNEGDSYEFVTRRFLGIPIEKKRYRGVIFSRNEEKYADKSNAWQFYPVIVASKKNLMKKKIFDFYRLQGLNARLQIDNSAPYLVHAHDNKYDQKWRVYQSGDYFFVRSWNGSRYLCAPNGKNNQGFMVGEKSRLDRCRFQAYAGTISGFCLKSVYTGNFMTSVGTQKARGRKFNRTMSVAKGVPLWKAWWFRMDK